MKQGVCPCPGKSSGLYPSSMISENLSHDSKVWTIEYDLAGNIIEEWGEKNKLGEAFNMEIFD